MAPIDNNGQSADHEDDTNHEDDTSTDLPPMLVPLAHQEDDTPLHLSEARRQLRSSLQKAITKAGGKKRCLIAFNACAKTTTGNLAVLSCRDHTGFDPRDAAAMTDLKHLKLLEEAVRDQYDFIKAFGLVFNKTPSMCLTGMRIVGTCTGDAGSKELSRCIGGGGSPKFATSQSHDTSKSSSTPALLGERAAEMQGVVFTLKTNVDNSQGGEICTKTRGMLNQNQDNTMLRFLQVQDRTVDMSK